MKRIKNNNEGQTSLDFLIGITLFLLVFIFVFAFIPRMFVPFQTNSDELTMAADRAALTLVENILIDDTHFESGESPSVYPGAKNPGIISKDKYQLLIADLNPASPNYISTKQKIGLGYQKSYGASAAMPSEIYYNIAIEFKTQDGITPESVGLNPIAFDLYGTSDNVGQSKRFIFVEDDSVAGNIGYTMAIMIVKVW